MALMVKRVRRLERRVERRRLRDAQNPFHLPRDEFINCFRLTPELVIDIATALRPDLQNERLTGLVPEIKWNVSQPTTSRCLHTVTEAINRRLLRRWIKFPMTAEDRQKAREKFSTAAYPFEGALGAIDCTFIHIIDPHEHEEAFINHHGRHSLNVQAIVDPDMKVLNINARYPGARNDSYIWSTSPIRRAMEFHYNRGERKTWLIGDAGYPLEPWLITPLADFPEDTRQFQYTQQLCKARNRVLLYKPEFAAKIVNACAVLHNIRIQHRLQDVEELQALLVANNHQNENVGFIDINEHVARRGPRAVAQRIQHQIMRERFPNYRDAQDEEHAEDN
ncbi:hypothetical protein DMN91_008549 [Ooceraea biroi]|uniref:DDE Tnp4 domain-containing protein n=1 Tax=Ooceraea biroi TaxID=2015173 RepID=A0A3L8DHS2_OOCBI|nr:hypothetical protein DMN91_008549 [Ooceraea biroi]